MGNNENQAEALHKKHEALTEKIFNDLEMLPNRYVYILTNKCNLKCDFCFLDRSPPKEVMELEDWKKLSEQLPDYARVSLTGGEPFMFKGFKEIFAYVAERYDCNIITNGTLLNKTLSDRILSFPKFRLLSISVDDVGNKIRGVSPTLWEKTERELEYFLKRRDEINPSCSLDIKTMILDETADQLFEIHKYCVETLRTDYHTFQFLKGSQIQHSDRSFVLEEIFVENPAQTYSKIEIIKDQLEKIRAYNISQKKISFLHPNVGSLVSDEGSFDHLSLMDKSYHKKENFQKCKYPWSSVHINVDGNLIPCLAVPMGNVKRQSLKEIISGREMKSFRELIRKEGTVAACNRCGWLKPNL